MQTDKGWNFDMSEAPTEHRKLCVVWKDRYSDHDDGGPRYTLGMTFWNSTHWANAPSSHWEAVAWAEFPPFDPAMLAERAQENNRARPEDPTHE